jgi:hypothetical protein
MPLMAMAFVLMAFMFVYGFGRLGLRGVFEGVGAGTQRFAFQALQTRQTICEFRDAIPDCVLGETTPFGRGDTSSHGKRVYRQGQTGQGVVCRGGTRKGTVIAPRSLIGGWSFHRTGSIPTLGSCGKRRRNHLLT